MHPQGHQHSTSWSCLLRLTFCQVYLCLSHLHWIFLADAIIDANFGQTQSFPVGLIIDDTNIACLTSPITPFEFPFDPTVDQYFDSVLAMLPEIPSTIDSMTRVINNPHVCGLNGDFRSKIRTLHLGTDHRFSLMIGWVCKHMSHWDIVTTC